MDDIFTFHESIAYAVMAAGSGWALVQGRDLQYARIAFGICFTKGVVGCVNSLLPKKDTFIGYWDYCVGLLVKPSLVPMLAAQAAAMAGYDTWALCHVAAPCLYAGFFENFRNSSNEQNWIHLSAACHAVSICFSAYKSGSLVLGGLTAAISLAATNCPYSLTRVMLMATGAANFVAVQFFNRTFGLYQT